MALFIGKRGVMRLFDSSKGRDLSQSGPKEVHISNLVSAVHNDITANMLNPTSGTATILAVNTDYVYVGQIFGFSRIQIDINTLASADGGVLVCEYWDGSAWTAVTNLLDGTEVGGHTMRQDGHIEFDIPSDWAKNDVPSTGTTLFYVRFRATNNTATDAIVELIEPNSGQFYEVVFEGMDLAAPEGKPRPEETPRLNRGILDTNAHHTQGLDDAIFVAQTLSFSAMLDSSVNKTALREALQCGNPASKHWVLTGISTKGDSKLPAGLDGTLINTPTFTDTNKKTVCMQVMFDDATVGARGWREYPELFFDLVAIQLAEAPDGVAMRVTGSLFSNVWSDLNRFGYRL